MRVREIGIPLYNENYSITKWSVCEASLPTVSLFCCHPCIAGVGIVGSNYGTGGNGGKEGGVGKGSIRLEIPLPFCLLITNGYTVSSVKIKDIIKYLPKVNLNVSR